MGRELPVPPSASKEAIEIVRVWAGDGMQHVSLATDIWDDPAAWGIMLVDLARHIAKSYESSSGVPSEKTISRIKEGFDAEWAESTDE